MANLSKWDGTLSPDDFRVAAKALVERWNQLHPSLHRWTWIPCTATNIGSSCKEEGYLSLEKIYHFYLHEECDSIENYSGREETSDDDATLDQSSNNETHIYNFHIVYSFSYMVPVLYFRGYHSDGQPLQFGDMENDLPTTSKGVLRESKWTYITQEEHPYLHRPWFTLHPCGTSNWMKLLLSGTSAKDLETVNYLPSWLSVVGQAVGLKIPLELHDKASEDQSAYSVMNS